VLRSCRAAGWPLLRSSTWRVDDALKDLPEVAAAHALPQRQILHLPLLLQCQRRRAEEVKVQQPDRGRRLAEEGVPDGLARRAKRNG